MNKTKIEELLAIVDQSQETIHVIFERSPLVGKGPEHKPLTPSNVDMVLTIQMGQIKMLREAIEELLTFDPKNPKIEM